MWKHRGDSQDGRRSRPYTREGLYEAGTIACNYQSKYKKDEKKENFEFKYKNKFEKQLILQIANKTFGDEWFNRIYTYSSGIGKRSIILIECTKFEETQIRIEYEFYKELWKEEVEFLFKVFIQKHNIFDLNGSSKNNTSEHKYSEKELKRMAMMEMLLQDKTMTKMLEVEK